MHLNHLKLRNFRCHIEFELDLNKAAWVVLAGGNGAGKTSLMEAIYAAARGRSFRAHGTHEMIRQGASEANVLLEAENGNKHRLGVVWRRQSKELHLDARPVAGMAEITSAIPVEYIGSATHDLINAAPARRRRFVDWGLFHVEPHFLSIWRAWHKAHRQRNEWLRRGDYPVSKGWTMAVAEYGEKLSYMRADLIGRLASVLSSGIGTDLSGAPLNLRFNRGWREDTLAEAFSCSAARERKAGRAVSGPQYDDWSIECGGLRAGQLSRGQSKLAGFFLLRALGEIMRERGRSAVLLIDDFLADLDATSSRSAVNALTGTGGQVWIAVQSEDYLLELPGEAARFHVELG